jgi:hypothetical protein
MDYLKSTKKEGTDASLYEHLLNVISKLVYDKPASPVDAFEDYSYSVKRGCGEEKSELELAKGRYTGFGEWNELARKLIERPKEETEEGLVEVAPEAISHIPDIVS